MIDTRLVVLDDLVVNFNYIVHCDDKRGARFGSPVR